MAKRATKAQSGRSALEEALDAVYLGDFEGFIERRNELAKRLRCDGDAEAGGAVRGVRKPSRIAWAINVAAAREPQLSEELLEAGAELRDAQEGLLTGTAERGELRDAGEREQRSVDALLRAVASLAADSGARLSAAALERARQTLHSVALDDAVRADFERRRLDAEHEASGLGGFALSSAGSPRRSGAKGARGANVQRGKDSAKEAARAKERKRQQASRKLREEVKAAEAAAAEREQRRERAELQAEEARAALDRARREHARAAKSLEAAQREAAVAGERLEELRGL